jgi:Peptidase C39 family
MTKFHFYPQPNAMDCGPTCIHIACPAFIAGVAKHYAKATNIEMLRQQSQISKEGVSLLGISEAPKSGGYLKNKLARINRTNVTQKPNIHLIRSILSLFIFSIRSILSCLVRNVLFVIGFHLRRS